MAKRALGASESEHEPQQEPRMVRKVGSFCKAVYTVADAVAVAPAVGVAERRARFVR